jgi:DNA (cytosine-5)-methyltransferase 1
MSDDLDLFAGAGGWEEGTGPLGIRPLGIELDADACATREAAGHRTLQADVATLSPREFAPCRLLIGSPPCQAFSVAGRRGGARDGEAIYSVVRGLERGLDLRDDVVLADRRSILVVEPLRWALACEPRWIALEQVPDVLGLWQIMSHALAMRGWKTWTGILNAADYGVAQTRRRAFLLASRDAQPYPPLATHKSASAEKTTYLFAGPEQPWKTMAQALGWGATDRPYVTLAGGTEGGPCYDFTGGSGARKQLLRAREQGHWVPNPWPWEFPATTVAGDPRSSARSHHESGEQGRSAKTTAQVRDGNYDGTEPIRLTMAEASILQGFRPDYPWQGTQTSKHLQIGNAVPPPLAHAVIRSLLTP